jgi:hypothetical protein
MFYFLVSIGRIGTCGVGEEKPHLKKRIPEKTVGQIIQPMRPREYKGKGASGISIRSPDVFSIRDAPE